MGLLKRVSMWQPKCSVCGTREELADVPEEVYGLSDCLYCHKCRHFSLFRTRLFSKATRGWSPASRFVCVPFELELKT